VPEPAARPAAAFAAALGGFGLFETAPHLAVAVSGGADSLALVLLAHAWARARGGSVTALTVDHRLRPDSVAEAARVGWQMRDFGIPHHILCWVDAKPQGGLQARARDARYRLLEDWCAGQGVLHLLTGHTADDQAETLLLRLRRGSTLYGLPGMTALAERPWGRLLRPLLACRHADLCDGLRRTGVTWIEDPSNRDPRFARSQLRTEIAVAQGGPVLQRLARRLGHLRRADDDIVTRLLARHVLLRAGRARIAGGLAQFPTPVAAALLGRVCHAVGGAAHAPAGAALDRALGHLDAGRATTLGGCHLLPDAAGLLVRPERPRRRGSDDAGVTGRALGRHPALGPAPFRLVSPPGGPTYLPSDSESHTGACMLVTPPPDGLAGWRGIQWRGSGQ